MPQPYMVAVAPDPTGRPCRSALSYRRSAAPRPSSAGILGAGHDCIASTLRCSLRTASRWCGAYRRATTPQATSFPSAVVVRRPDVLEQHVGQLRAAHEEVGEIGIMPVVDQRRAVQPRRVQTGGLDHTGWRGGIPLPLAARM